MGMFSSICNTGLDAPKSLDMFFNEIIDKLCNVNRFFVGFNLTFGCLYALNFFLHSFGKMRKNLLFFQAAMVRLGKYLMGGYGRIGVYRECNCHGKVLILYKTSYCEYM